MSANGPDPCRQPGCDGAVEGGYCNVCGMVASKSVTSSMRMPVASGPPPAGATVVTRAGSARTNRTTSAGRRRIAGVVELPAHEPRDPAAAILADPRVTEEKRFCANPTCGAPVGRARDGEPGLTEGFCSRCREPFSFRPKLATGDLVGGQYEVAGCLAHGGLGWIHLARDRNVHDKYVVLKGLLNTSDPDARAAALAERRYLAEIDHPNIVRIINFVEHGNDGYIVMDYVSGTSLGVLLDERRGANGGNADPLPVTHAIAFMLEVLPAFGYLHRAGLLYCDLKPDNVMQSGTTVKLIDLGAAYPVDEPTSAVYGTTGYQAPEIEQRGPSVPSDLFTVGRTLAALCTVLDRTQNRYTIPGPDREPLYARHDSLYRFLLRATAFDPDDRFQSADEMGAQLAGVLREVVAAETGAPVPGVSECFTVEVPTAADALDDRALPALLVSADDPAAGFLASLPSAAGDDAIALLAAAPERSREVVLRHVRLLLDDGRRPEADALLQRVAADDPSEWRVSWYRGIARLQAEQPEDAITEFEAVGRVLPGELAPKLALGFAHEDAGDLTGAARWYDVVSRTDPTFTSAAFGLGRCRRAAGDIAGAVAAYGRVAESSRAFFAAQAATADALLAGGVDIPAGDLAAAARAVDRLPRGSRERAELTTRLFEAALAVLRRDGLSLQPGTLLGVPFTETEVRFGLEHAYRERARFAPSVSERITLVDRANAARPRTLT